MKRCTIHAMISLEVVGDDDEQVAECLADAICLMADGVGIESATLVNAETIDIPFFMPPGAERWAAAADFRFGERRKLAPMHDGSWWWTDGHAAYRAEGEPPTDFKVIPDAFASKSFGGGDVPVEERRTEWDAPTKKRTDNYETVRSMIDPEVAIQRRYRDVVMGAVPSAYWTTTGEGRAVRAYADGRLIAVVMPVRQTATPVRRIA